MKIKNLLLVFILLFPTLFYAQQFTGPSDTTSGIYRVGNIGLGGSPQEKLHITTGKLMIGDYFARYEGVDDHVGIKSEGSIIVRPKNSWINAAVIEISRDQSFVQMAVAGCNGCYSNNAIEGDLVLRAYSYGVASGRSLIVSNEGTGSIKFATKETTNGVAKVQMAIDKYGKVGIGTETPAGNLEVAGGLPNGTVFSDVNERNEKSLVCNAGSLLTGSDKYRNIKFFNFPQSNLDALPKLWFGIEDRNNFGRYRLIATTGGSTQMVVLDKTQSEVFNVVDDGNNQTVVSLPKANSFLGIGTTTFTDGTDTYKLSVKGKVRAEEVKVYTTWADYVFDKEYQLPSLEEVEKHIKEKGHLINVPSGKEIEENGLFIGEITKIQQEKIEELTLYLIQQKKEIEELKAQIKILLKKSN